MSDGDEVERLVIGVRADLGGFRRDVDAMRGELAGPLAAGAKAAGNMLERSLLQAVRTGKLGFDDLKRVALSALAEIAAAALRSGLGGGAKGGVANLGGALLGLFGLPGRATGGPGSPGRGYLVGERGPELFVPTASGRVEPSVGAAAGGPMVVNVRVVAPAGTGEPEALARSARQVGRAVRRSLGG